MYRTYIDEDGYRRFTDTNKPVHWWVMEKKIGRRLRISLHRQGYNIHHINGNKLDNRPENLEMIPSSAHEQRHGLRPDTFSRENVGSVNNNVTSNGIGVWGCCGILMIISILVGLVFFMQAYGV